MKILHLITTLDTGGTEMMLYKLLSQINKEEFSCRVVSLTSHGIIADNLESLGIPVSDLGMRRGVVSLGGFVRLTKLLNSWKPTIMQTWLYHADLLGLVAGKLARVPVIVWNLRCSDMDMQHYSWTSTLVLRVLAALAAVPQAVLVNSKAGRRWHERLGYNPRSWIHIPNGFDLTSFQPDEEARVKFRRSLALSNDAILIGLVARHDPMKDHATFLKAAHILLEKDSRVHFVLVGSGITWENMALRGEIQPGHHGDHFHLLGERDDVSRIMVALDIATSSSRSEGFPNTIGEAMACGVPCVVTDAGDSARLVGDTGVVVPVKNPQALAEGWGKMIELGEIGRRQLGIAARCRIEEKFSLPAVVTRYEEFYRRSVASVRIRRI